MMIHPRLTRAAGALLAIAAVASSSCKGGQGGERAADGVVGTYRLVSLEEPAADGTLHHADCTGSLVLTRDGRMSVQVMYREAHSPAAAAPVQYAQGGYEASFGSFHVDEPGRSFTYRVEGALVRALVGKDLKRIYELSGNRLVVMPPTADERWRVTWERYGALTP
jgi:hypothetical protein